MLKIYIDQNYGKEACIWVTKLTQEELISLWESILDISQYDRLSFIKYFGGQTIHMTPRSILNKMEEVCHGFIHLNENTDSYLTFDKEHGIPHYHGGYISPIEI